MDDKRCDGLTRILRRVVGRRLALTTVVAGGLVGAASAIGRADPTGATRRQGVAGAVPNDCESDADCPPNGLCLLNETCFFPGACAGGASELDCCQAAVRTSCRHSGGGQTGHGAGGRPCRRKGFQRCRKNFGTTP